MSEYARTPPNSSTNGGPIGHFCPGRIRIPGVSFEPFDLDPALLWLCSVGIARLCAYATAAAPKMRLFLTLLSVSPELAGGLAVHAVRSALKVRQIDWRPLDKAIPSG
jgi:hypothetical protein